MVAGESPSGGGGGGETLKIGFMGDLTGENSGIVIPPSNGAKLVIDEYNATNPAVKLELVEYDSQGSPDQAVPLAQQAIQPDKIVGLIGPAFSGESKAGRPGPGAGDDPEHLGIRHEPAPGAERLEVLAPGGRQRRRPGSR